MSDAFDYICVVYFFYLCESINGNAARGERGMRFARQSGNKNAYWRIGTIAVSKSTMSGCACFLCLQGRVCKKKLRVLL